MKASRPRWFSSAQAGFTLVEVMVVLVLLTLAAAIVAPSLLSTHSEPDELTLLVRNAREASIHRGQTVHLHVDRSGAWHASAGSPPQTELLSSGRISGTGEPVDLLFSPLGTCAFPAEVLPAQASPAVDPFTCEVRFR